MKTERIECECGNQSYVLIPEKVTATGYVAVGKMVHAIDMNRQLFSVIPVYVAPNAGDCDFCRVLAFHYAYTAGMRIVAERARFIYLIAEPDRIRIFHANHVAIREWRLCRRGIQRFLERGTVLAKPRIDRRSRLWIAGKRVLPLTATRIDLQFFNDRQVKKWFWESYVGNDFNAEEVANNLLTECIVSGKTELQRDGFALYIRNRQFYLYHNGKEVWNQELDSEVLGEQTEEFFEIAGFA